MFEEQNKLNPEIILPVFDFNIFKTEENMEYKCDDLEKIIYYYDDKGISYCLIIDDLKNRFQMDNYYNPHVIGSLLSEDFINNFKIKYMSNYKPFNNLTEKEMQIYESLPSIYEIINKELNNLEIEKENYTDNGLEKKCNYCSKILDDNYLKSIIHTNEKTEHVYYCSFKCFEKTDNSYWPKYKKNKKT